MQTNGSIFFRRFRQHICRCLNSWSSLHIIAILSMSEQIFVRYYHLSSQAFSEKSLIISISCPMPIVLNTNTWRVKLRMKPDAIICHQRQIKSDKQTFEVATGQKVKLEGWRLIFLTLKGAKYNIRAEQILRSIDWDLNAAVGYLECLRYRQV